LHRFVLSKSTLRAAAAAAEAQRQREKGVKKGVPVAGVCPWRWKCKAGETETRLVGKRKRKKETFGNQLNKWATLNF